MFNIKKDDNIVFGKSHSGKTRYLIMLANSEHLKKDVVFINNEETAEALYNMGLNKDIEVISTIKEKYNLDELCDILRESRNFNTVYCIDNINMFLKTKLTLDETKYLKVYSHCIFSYNLPISGI